MMTKKQMEHDLCGSMVWMVFSSEWTDEKFMVISAIVTMKQSKNIRLYKKRYKRVRDFITKCMKYDIIHYRYDEFVEFVSKSK